MSMDTLTALEYGADQRRYVQGTPTIGAGRAFIEQTLTRPLSSSGLVLARRIVSAILVGSEGLAPPAAAPMAHRSIYSTFRRAGHLAYLALISLNPSGDDSPILTTDAGAALITIETSDVLVAADPALADALGVMLDGCSWRLG